jgi:hypothetical protein
MKMGLKTESTNNDRKTENGGTEKGREGNVKIKNNPIVNKYGLANATLPIFIHCAKYESVMLQKTQSKRLGRR